MTIRDLLYIAKKKYSDTAYYKQEVVVKLLSDGRILYRGELNGLYKIDGGWGIVAYYPDETDDSSPYVWNKRKIITVI